LEPALAVSKKDLKPGEKNLVFADGGEAGHLKEMEQNPDLYIDDCEEKRVVYVKNHVNSTSHAQVCDLITLFKRIKNPAQELLTCTAEEYTRWVANMTRILEEPMQYVKKDKRILYIESFAILLNKVLPALTQLEVHREFNRVLQFPRPDLRSTLMLGMNNDGLPLPFDKEMLDILESPAATGTFVSCVLKQGYLMDAVMTELKIPEGAFNLDDVVLRSKRMVIVTNTNTVEEAISRACGAWKRGARTAAERKELEEKESAVEQAKQLQFQKLETSAETKLKSEEKLNKAELKLIIRKRSEESEAPAGDTTCKGTKCPVRLSVLEEFKNSYAHPAKVTQMYECQCPKNCGKFCFFCFATSNAFEKQHPVVAARN
jgi:hypothetical protein